MPDLVEVGPQALSGLTALNEFYCTHNAKLTTINVAAFSRPAVGEGAPEGVSWPPLKKVSEANVL